ncbi:Rieske (2Fe-2S) protein [Streptomyces sp. NPDC052052]|uniref:Rieske (2Fe-2S) protein n=1 Tax=Streptomyces sp. NPDC052052 TaxID=3154756 RepID=UPI003416011E
MTASQEHEDGPGRRSVVAAIGAVSAAAVLTACGSQKDSDGTDAIRPAMGGRSAARPTDGGSTEAAGESLAKTSDIPEGGGTVFADRGVVVTQPKAGEFKAFSADCPHQGCAVSSVSNGVINCPCHGSKFDVATGEVKRGPATRPLAARSIRVSGDSITLAP